MRSINRLLILAGLTILALGLVGPTGCDDDDDDDDDGNSLDECKKMVNALVECGADQFIEDFDEQEYIDFCVDSTSIEFNCVADCYADYLIDDSCPNYFICIVPCF